MDRCPLAFWARATALSITGRRGRYDVVLRDDVGTKLLLSSTAVRRAAVLALIPLTNKCFTQQWVWVIRIERAGTTRRDDHQTLACSAVDSGDRVRH